MVRFLAVLVRNLVVATFALLVLPGRAVRARRRPEWVRFKLAGDPPYRLVRRRWLQLRRAEPEVVRSLEQLRTQLALLAADPRVKGAVFELDGFAGSAAKRASIALLFQTLRAAGKQVVGFAVSAGNGELELLCAADRIAMPPAGRLELTGFSAEATALGVGLKRLGVEAQFIRRGEHKTAPELFTNEVVSPIQRETIERLLDERYEALVAALARGRKLAPEEARARVDEGPYSAKRAKVRGLIDAVVSRADLGRFLAGLPIPAPAEIDPKEKGPRLAPFDAYAASLLWAPGTWKRLLRRPRLAVVPLGGMIVHGRGVGPRFSGSETIARALRSAAKDARCRAIVLHIDSPGGSALGSELILDEVKRAAKKKPVVAYFDEVAASGGYMAALGGTEIWAAPLAVAGSIGVFAGKFDLSGLLGRLGVHRTLVTRGKNAGLFSSSRGFTESERAALEAEIEETYVDFLDHVATARKRTREDIRAKAEGRIYSGRAAVEAGLVDRTGLFDDACRRALELAGRPVAEFDVAVFAPAAPRFSLGRILRQLGQARMLALWHPWLEFPVR